MGVVVLKEGNQRCSDRGNLLRSHVHEVNLCRRNYGIVGILATLYFIADEATIFAEGCVTLTDNLSFFLLGTEVDNVVVVKVGHRVFDDAIRGFNET